MPLFLRARFIVAGLACALACQAVSQTEQRPSYKDLYNAAGDIVMDPTGVDASLSPKITHGDVRRAMKKVADWEIKRSESKFTQDWTYAPLYSGLLAASATLSDTK